MIRRLAAGLRAAYAAARGILLVRILLGTLIGLAIGSATAIVFGQQGSLAPRRMGLTIVLGVAVGLVLSLVPLPRLARRTVTWGSRLLAVASLVVLPTVSAIAIECDVLVDVDGSGPEPFVDAFSSTPDQPLRVLLEDGRRVDVRARVAVPDGSALQVAVVDLELPVDLVTEPLTLMFERIADAEVERGIEVVEVGPPEYFVARGESGLEQQLPPLGTATLRATVRSSAGPVEGCDGGDVYVRFVAAPGSTLIGWIAILTIVLGLLALPAVLPPEQRRGVDEEGESAAPPSRPEHVADRFDGDREEAPTLVAGASRRASHGEPARSDPIPSRGRWHVEGIEARLVDQESGRVVPADEPMVVGSRYELQVTVGEGLEDPPTPEQLAEIAVHGDHDGTPFEPVAVDPSLGLATVPVEPETAGLLPSVLDILHRGNHVQTERLSLPVVEPGATTEAVQATQTQLASNEVTATALSRQTPRDVLVVVEVLDGRVLTRVHAHRSTLSPPVQPEHGALVEAVAALATSVRDALTDRLRDGGGTRLRVPPFRHDEDLLALATVGRELRHSLLGPDPAAMASLRDLVTDGAMVQVVQDTLRLGSATLPYQLLYDHPLSGGAADPTVCLGDHAVDSCPSLDDLDVVCPSGLWGNRAVVEEVLPRTADAPDPMPPPVAVMTGTGAAFVDPDDELHRDPLRPDAPVLDVADELGLEPLVDLDAVMGALGRDVGLLYLYGHSASRPYASEIGLRVGASLLLGSDLRERQLRRPSGGVVFVNACGSGAGSVTDVMTMLRALLEIGSTTVVATETTMWAPFANRLAADLLTGVAKGEPIGRVLLELRRGWWRDHGNHVGLTFRLHGRADAVWRPEPRPAPPSRPDRATEPDAASHDRVRAPATGGGAV